MSSGERRKGPGGRREPPGGRPPKGNVRLVCYVLPETRKAADNEAEREGLTLGEVIDRWYNATNSGSDKQKTPTKS